MNYERIISTDIRVKPTLFRVDFEDCEAILKIFNTPILSYKYSPVFDMHMPSYEYSPVIARRNKDKCTMRGKGSIIYGGNVSDDLKLSMGAIKELFEINEGISIDWYVVSENIILGQFAIAVSISSMSASVEFRCLAESGAYT